MEIISALLVGLLAGFALLWAPIAWMACAAFSWILAREKQYSGISWFLLGILFGPVTLVATAGLPNRTALLKGELGHRRLEPAIND